MLGGDQIGQGSTMHFSPFRLALGFLRLLCKRIGHIVAPPENWDPAFPGRILAFRQLSLAGSWVGALDASSQPDYFHN